jgi:hypothetical protein
MFLARNSLTPSICTIFFLRAQVAPLRDGGDFHNVCGLPAVLRVEDIFLLWHRRGAAAGVVRRPPLAQQYCKARTGRVISFAAVWVSPVKPRPGLLGGELPAAVLLQIAQDSALCDLTAVTEIERSGAGWGCRQPVTEQA